MNKISNQRKYIGTEECEVQQDNMDHCKHQKSSAVLNPFIHQFSLNTTYDMVKHAWFIVSHKMVPEERGMVRIKNSRKQTNGYYKMFFMSIFILPLRILMIMILLVMGYAVTKMGTYGLTRDEFQSKPLSGHRSVLRWCLGFLGRMLMRCYAFHWVKIKGRLASRDEAPIIVVGPHSSFMDGIAVFWSDLPGLVSRIENLQLPFFGRYIDYTQPVYVHRDDSKSRQTSISEIKERVKSKEKWSQVIIYPEGTCTNRTCLITFKAGAFYPGLPVQPMIIRYPNKKDCITWTWDGPSTLKTIWTTLCQIHNHCELEYLPVYRPSQEEIDDPYLYARNVRQVMADALGVPVADYTYDDCRIMHKARLKNLPSETGLIEFQKIKKSLGNITLKDVDDQLSEFASMALTEGKISLRNLSTALGIPTIEPTLVELFNLYDKDGEGVISFRDFLSYRYTLLREVSCFEAIKLSFKFLAEEREGSISIEDFSEVLRKKVTMETESSSRLFKEIDHNGRGFLTLDDFHEYSKRKPECAKLFLLYGKSVREGTRTAALSVALSNGLHKSKVE